MSSYVNKLACTLRKDVWLLAAFLVPLTIRCIPEVLSWPYPLGLDTLRYIPTFESGIILSSPLSVLQNQLFYSLTSSLYTAVPNGVLIIKLLGPILLGLLAFMAFLYAKHNLHWSDFKSFFVSLLIGSYFVALRNSWDLYSQTLGLIFLFACLLVLKSSVPYKYFFVGVLMFLTVWCHELVSVILFFIIVLEAVTLLIKGKKKDFTFFVPTGIVAVSFFIIRRFSTVTGTVVIPANDVVSTQSFTPIIMGGLVLYCYVLLLPLAILGFYRLKKPAFEWLGWLVFARGFAYRSISKPSPLLLESLGILASISFAFLCGRGVR